MSESTYQSSAAPSPALIGIGPPTGQAPVLDHSATPLLTATLVPLIVPSPTTTATTSPTIAPGPGGTPAAGASSGRALLKQGYVRQLGLRSGEVDEVLRHAASATRELVQHTSIPWALLAEFEVPVASSLLLPGPAALAEVPVAVLLAFGAALIAVRREIGRAHV
jgi:hypothetical protein